MLHLITDPAHALLRYICDDPVRPELPSQFRVEQGRFVCMTGIDGAPEAIVCVSLSDRVPTTVADLQHTVDDPTIAIFYTIWSYKPGAGRTLLNETVQTIVELFPSVSRFVTLSPKTELARRFHLRNGAVILQENAETINYEYHRSGSLSTG